VGWGEKKAGVAAYGGKRKDFGDRGKREGSCDIAKKCRRQEQPKSERSDQKSRTSVKRGKEKQFYSKKRGRPQEKKREQCMSCGREKVNEFHSTLKKKNGKKTGFLRSKRKRNWR